MITFVREVNLIVVENTAKKGFDLDGPTFKELLAKTPGSILVDVRSAVEFYEGTIPGAINIDYLAKDFDEKIMELDPAKTYFVFCRNGNRSLAACKAMEKRNLKVYRLQNGIGNQPF